VSRLLLLRHGQSTWNAAGRWQGKADPPLSELGVRQAQVQSAVELLDGGASVPFIARYRKEATEGLDDTQLRELEVRLAYLRELQERHPSVARVDGVVDSSTLMTLHALIDSRHKPKAEPQKADIALDEDLFRP